MRRQIIFLFLFAAGNAQVGAFPWSAEENAAVLGKKVARETGCFACHGAGGTGGVKNPGSASGTVPGWDSTMMAMYVHSDKEFYEWILDGVPKRLRGAKRVDGPKGAIPMPAYRDILSKKEVEALVAYLRAVSGSRGVMPDGVYEGKVVAERMGCSGCHGPSGMGGIPNPGSFKGYVPSLTGSDYDELVHNEQELREWILDGRIKRLWNNVLAKRYLKRQKTQMPAYREHLAEGELEKLIAYLHWLRKPAYLKGLKEK